MMGQSPLIYRSSAPMCQMNYAEAMEKDGVFGEVAKKAWADASDRLASLRRRGYPQFVQLGGLGRADYPAPER